MHSLGVCRIHTTRRQFPLFFLCLPESPAENQIGLYSAWATRRKTTHSTKLRETCFSFSPISLLTTELVGTRSNDDRSDHSPAWRIDLRNLSFLSLSLLCMATMESATGGQWREWRLIGDRPISLSFLLFLLAHTSWLCVWVAGLYF